MANKLNDNDPDEYILQNLSRGYIASIFAMSLGKNSFHYDYMRVKYHSAIEELFSIKYDTPEEKELNRLFHSLQSEIDFPIPEHQGYGVCSLSRKQLTENFAKLTAVYGDALAIKLKGKFNINRK